VLLARLVLRVIGGGLVADQVSGAVRLQEQGDVPVGAGARAALGLRGVLMAGECQRRGSLPVGCGVYRDEGLVGVGRRPESPAERLGRLPLLLLRREQGIVRLEIMTVDRGKVLAAASRVLVMRCWVRSPSLTI
jgi:hypothetical protein